MSKNLLFIVCSIALVGLTGCQGGFGPGANRPSGSFTGSWDGGWNRNWNGPRGTPYRPSGGLFAGLTGGNQNPNQVRVNSAQEREIARLNNQIRNMQNRIGGFDTDNNGLHSEIASLKQQLQRSNNLNTTLRQQLGDMAASVQQLQNTNQQYQQQLADSRSRNQQLAHGNGVPTRFTGSATIRANNSLLQRLPEIRVDGVETRMDGDVIRIEIPTDRVFVPGTYQVSSQANTMLNSLVTAISRNFPNQFVGVEGHWDRSPLGGGISAHQLTATQALSVFNYMTNTGLPQHQVFSVAMGNNRPRYQGANIRNRRIEIVIYPESYRR